MAHTSDVTTQALGVGDLTTIGIVVTLVLLLGGLLLGLLITALVGRALIAIVVIVLAVLVWQQRSSVENKIRQKCQLSATYFGVHLSAPADVRQKCRSVGS